jgi:hypothetical protein
MSAARAAVRMGPVVSMSASAVPEFLRTAAMCSLAAVIEAARVAAATVGAGDEVAGGVAD